MEGVELGGERVHLHAGRLQEDRLHVGAQGGKERLQARHLLMLTPFTPWIQGDFVLWNTEKRLRLKRLSMTAVSAIIMQMRCRLLVLDRRIDCKEALGRV